MVYSQLDPKKQNLVKYQLKIEHFDSRKYVWKCRLENWKMVAILSRP